MQRTRRLFRGEAEYRGRAFGIRQTLCGSGAAAVAFTLGVNIQNGWLQAAGGSTGAAEIACGLRKKLRRGRRNPSRERG
jgi:hypothetical protein